MSPSIQDSKKVHTVTPTFGNEELSDAIGLSRCRHLRSEIRDGGSQTGCTSILASTQDSKESLTAIPTPGIRGRGTQWRYREGSILTSEVINSRWRQPTRMYLYLIFYTRWPKIPAAKHMFAMMPESLEYIVAYCGHACVMSCVAEIQDGRKSNPKYSQLFSS
jgi:hypothetical protein